MEHRFAARGVASPTAESAGLRRAASAVASRPRGQPAGAADAELWSGLLGGERPADAELQMLVTLSQVHQVAAGQQVLGRGEPAHALVALREGDVALGLRSGDGSFHTERIVRGPAWLDLGSAWIGQCHVMDAQALGPAGIVELPLEAFTARLPDHPGLAQRLIQGLAREVRVLASHTHELMHKDAPARLAHWLRQRSEPVAGSAGQALVELHERKRDVASQLAITPETLSRLMRSFSQLGVIEVSGYSVRVLDAAALGRLARG